MTRTGKGLKTVITEGILAKIVWVGTSWNWEEKTARTGWQTRQIQGGKPAGTCGVLARTSGGGDQPELGWEAELGEKKRPEPGREKWPEVGRTCPHMLKVLIGNQKQLSLSRSCGICLMP